MCVYYYAFSINYFFIIPVTSSNSSSSSKLVASFSSLASRRGSAGEWAEESGDPVVPGEGVV